MATVTLATKAKNDLNSIKEFYRKPGLNVAKKVIESILDDLVTLETAPGAGHPPDDPYLKARGYRCWIVYSGRYIAFYQYMKQKHLVKIQRILPTKDKYLKLIFNRK
jgi:plasmid stabilization system protein ParE